jgi:hypothetical protein
VDRKASELAELSQLVEQLLLLHCVLLRRNDPTAAQFVQLHKAFRRG